jgi:hypothetical protein
VSSEVGMSDRVDERRQTGTGESRSGEVRSDGGAASRDEASERAVVPGATSESRATEEGTGFANRSGSGGSGGSGDPLDEGSGGRTMDELLEGGGPPERSPRH